MFMNRTFKAVLFGITALLILFAGAGTAAADAFLPPPPRIFKNMRGNHRQA